ncbi:MAG: hypothetical protein M1531_12605 [Chloroflexi bacterium]|nr:hypothetical protein [Chloroflexota bacterium]
MIQAVGLDEAQTWALSAAFVALVIAVVISLILSWRARAASAGVVEARVRESRTQLEQQLTQHAHENAAQVAQLQSTADAYGREVAQMGGNLQDLAARADRSESNIRLASTQIILLQAVSKATKARIHLTEQNTGLAERDLTEAEAALQRALAVAPDALKPGIEESRRALDELKQSVEARTFPVAAVEILTDRIESLLASQPGG